MYNWWKYEVDEETEKRFAVAVNVRCTVDDWVKVICRLFCWYADKRGIDYRQLTFDTMIDQLARISNGYSGYASIIRQAIVFMSKNVQLDQELIDEYSELIFGDDPKSKVSHWIISEVYSITNQRSFLLFDLRDTIKQMIDELHRLDTYLRFRNQIFIAIFAGMNNLEKIEAGMLVHDINFSYNSPVRVKIKFKVPKCAKHPQLQLGNKAASILNTYRLKQSVANLSDIELIDKFLCEYGGD